MTKRFLLAATILLSAVFYFGPSTEAEAIDPVTIAILTPVAIQAAKILAPYVIRGLKNMTVVLLRAGGNLISFFRFPIGLLQVTILAPFGQFKSGFANMGKGLWAPFQMCGNLLMLPLSIFGIGV
jgi:hypothetical protein